VVSARSHAINPLAQSPPLRYGEKELSMESPPLGYGQMESPPLRYGEDACR